MLSHRSAGSASRLRLVVGGAEPRQPVLLATATPGEGLVEVVGQLHEVALSAVRVAQELRIALTDIEANVDTILRSAQAASLGDRVVGLPDLDPPPAGTAA